jgi:hypothetical protein
LGQEKLFFSAQKCLAALVIAKHVLAGSLNYLLMPSVSKRKAKNTQNAQLKAKEREKEAKKKLERSQLPEKGKKR